VNHLTGSGSPALADEEEVAGLPHGSGERPLLALDLDDTIVYSAAHYYEWAARQTRLTPRQTLLTTFFDKHLEALPFIPGAKSSMAALHEEYDLMIITARPSRLLEPTRSWLSQHFPPEMITRVECHPGDHVEGWSKAEVMLRHGALLLVDDDQRHTNECSRLGLPALLARFVSSSEADPPAAGVHPVFSWSEAETTVRRVVGSIKREEGEAVHVA